MYAVMESLASVLNGEGTGWGEIESGVREREREAGSEIVSK
jgi:hypothetical protein